MGPKGLAQTPKPRQCLWAAGGTVTCPGRLAVALGTVGVTHQNRHLHDVGLLKELGIHGWPRLEQDAGVPGVASAQLLRHQRQACHVKARESH